MAHEHERFDLRRVVEEIRDGFSAPPGSLTDEEFDRLCRNIARAIVRAVEAHGARIHSPEPDFGEEERVGG